MKKLTLIILAMAFCQLATSAYTDVTPESYLENQIIEDSLNFGADYIIRQAIGRNVLPEGNYEIKSLTKIEQQLLKNGVDYRFHIHIASTNGVNVRGRFTVYYRYSTKVFKVVSQHYNYNYPSDLKDLENEEYNWEQYDFEIPDEEHDEEDAETPIEEETQIPETPEEGSGEHENPSEEWELPIEGETGNPEEWEFPGEGETESPSEEWEYPPGEEWEGVPGEEVEIPGGGEHEWSEWEFTEEEFVIPEEGNGFPEEGGEAPEEEESQSPPPKGYVDLAPEVYLKSQVIEDGLNFGADYIIRQAIGKDVIPEGNYEIVSLSRVEQQLLKNGVDYRYHVYIASTQGVNVRGRFTVYYRYSTKKFKVVSQHYKYRYPSKLNDQENEYDWDDYNFDDLN